MKTKTVNHILEIRARGNKKRKLVKICKTYIHAKNMFYLLINKNFDFFVKTGITLQNLNLLFTDKIYNRGNSDKKITLKKSYENELLTNDKNKELFRQLKNIKRYLGNAIFQSLIKEVVNNYKSYFASIQEYKKNPSKFKAIPQPPKPKKIEKVNNCSIEFSSLVFKVLTTSKGKAIQLKLNSKGTNIKIKLPDEFDEKVTSVRVVKKLDDYYVQIVYKIEIPAVANIKNIQYIAGIDLGLDNLMTIVSNHPNLKSVIINGRELKSFNQWYNKVKAKLQSEENKLSRRKLERYRMRRIKSVFHQITSKLVNMFLLFDIKHVVVGKSAIESKQEINLGDKTNQNFVYLPFRMLVEQLKYKCEKHGIRVTEVDESYTSKTSALTGNIEILKDKEYSNITDKLKKQLKFNGERIKRGLFKDTILNKIWNADCNGALNIIKRVKADIVKTLSLKQWIDKLARPIRIFFYDINNSSYNFILKVSLRIPNGIAGSNGELY
jgi:IS605 OrfB family transposase